MIVLLFVCLGLRVSELCGLDLEETDLARGGGVDQGQSRREGVMPLSEIVVAAIRCYLRVAAA